MIQTLAFAGYRSLRDLRMTINRTTVITGANGTGKSSVYRALRLLTGAADGQLAPSLAREGGMPSALWAGRPSKRTKSDGLQRLSLGFADDQLAYELRLGVPGPGHGAFYLDPVVKEETLRAVGKRRVTVFERRNQSVTLRDYDGAAISFGAKFSVSESVLSQLAEPQRYPVLSSLRDRLRGWRFYHHIRTDLDSPVRAAQSGTRTTVLAHDGHDLAAALQTINENGDHRALASAIADAFEGARLRVESDKARFRIELETPGVYRPLEAAELSDGTLRYIALLAELYSPNPPELLILNEPEMSLHSRLLVPLARQIVAASARSQVIVISHAGALVDAISATRDATRIDLVKQDGETKVSGRKPDEPSWKWTS